MTSNRLAKHRLRGVFSTALVAVMVFALTMLVWFKTSPWPSALVIRWVFECGGAAMNEALSRAVPAGIRTQHGLAYDANEPDAKVDIHRPVAAGGRPLPIIVWVHGGGFVAGSRLEVANYARILAAEGYAVAAVDYSLAPRNRYPTPLLQINQAVAFLSENAARLGLDRNRFVLGGDSAGAQLAAQLSALVSSPDYARSIGVRHGLSSEQLRGAVLFCGPHDARLMAQRTSSSWFLRTVLWSYLGSDDPPDETLHQFSVVPHVTAAFPPTFITVGNADPLAPQSYALAEALRAKGVHVVTLFYPASHAPPLGHEYQFDLSKPESLQVLSQTRAFLGRLEVGGAR